MRKILYNFDEIKSSLDILSSKLSDIDNLMGNINGFSSEVGDISSDLESAQKKTLNYLEDIETSIDSCIGKTNCLCNDYLRFESKMLSNPIFDLDFQIDSTTAPESLSGSNESDIL